MKKVLSTLAVCACLTIPTVGASADTIENANSNQDKVVTQTVNVGVSENQPKAQNIQRLMTKPGSSDVVNLTKSQMAFAGQARSAILYTNNHFKGKSTVSYKIKNLNKKDDLTVKVYAEGDRLATETLTINASSTSTGTISGLDKTKKYYLAFAAPSHFEGHVK
ncbi:hypothetical protein FT641_19470 [Bacillus paranthracis]|uniref:hypothetical protein n=1 Tax=Bacillus paranthracis TaxID=2026186 RepID=UPI0018797236|nr:hypothetical protein [Bacillus paranthracis]MBE7114254.1 hypothetical protein [Bacillus paranthracis]MBE7154873.1 hypothetical protein [Bacillus paranthracis]